MGYRRYYRNDPHWINAHFASQCAKCKTTIPQGTKAFYYPSTKSLYGDKCGCANTASADFESAVFDEDFARH